MTVSLSTALDDPSAVPYFLWGGFLRVAELRLGLRTGSPEERIRLSSKGLREARDIDVWKFTTPKEILRQWPKLRLHLAHRRAFWDYLFGRWHKAGLLDDE